MSNLWFLFQPNMLVVDMEKFVSSPTGNVKAFSCINSVLTFPFVFLKCKGVNF